MSSESDSARDSAALPLAGIILILEASTAAGGVALLDGHRVVAERDVPMGAGQSDGLFPGVQEVLRDAGIRPSAVRALVCGEGPGSFTSLRIAASLMKGFAYGLGLPLYSVSSLLLAAAALPESITGNLVVHADALRGERYVLPVRREPSGRVAAAGPVARISNGELLEQTQAAQRVALLASPADITSTATIAPRAAMVPLIDGPWRNRPVDLASWEPLYGRLAEAQVKWEASHGRALPPMLPSAITAG
jgi:tRNA threonylcarbamoyladenosine biosynthesis protein TsaB